MKLKLETQDGIKILVVTEQVGPQHTAVLRAGLTKMFGTGIKSLVLDLTGAGQIPKEALDLLASARTEAEEHDVRFLIVAVDPEFSDLPNRQEAVSRLNSPLAEMLSDEAKLQSQLKRLQRRKASLEQKLAAMGKDVKSLLKENSDLKEFVSRTEKQVEAMQKTRREPAFVSSLEQRQEQVRKILSAILEQEGVLPLK